MKTSVVLTTYNGEKYLLEMLDSIRLQSRKPDEVVIVDDNSTDRTVTILCSYINKWKLTNWTLKINDTNVGWELNFKNAFSLANGDIIFPADQDDIWHLDKISKMAGAFENNHEIQLLVSGYAPFNENGKQPNTQEVKTISNDRISRVVFDDKYYQILRPGCAMAFKKEILPIFDNLWKKGTPHDALLWVIASLCDSLYLYDEILIDYRKHSNNATKNISHEFKYKLNEVERTIAANNWYINSPNYISSKEKIIKSTNTWCSYRIELLKNKKIIYWFKLIKYRRHYLTFKKYIGDLYYFFKG